jgi:predicted glycogen debranching enzyme
MSKRIRKIDIRKASAAHAREILQREWLQTNGLGGYASGTVCGMVTRRYHGLLVAALPPPLGRVVMLNHLSEFIRLPDGRRIQIGGNEPSHSDEDAHVNHAVREFRLDTGIPYWIYEVEDIALEKRLFMVHGQNTVHITYRVLSSHENVSLELAPSVGFRCHEHDVTEAPRKGYSVCVEDEGYTVVAPQSSFPLRLQASGAPHSFSHQKDLIREIEYEKEAERGYPHHGILWSPGSITFELNSAPATLTASSEPWTSILALSVEEAFQAELERRERLLVLAGPKAEESVVGDLALAADQFLIRPAWRAQDTARAKALGDDVRTVIAGYHWFTDWGRDTMISLEGLTISTGRHVEARWLLRTFAHYIRDGLIPNLFPEGESAGLYHTADATLWFFHAVDRYLANVEDSETLKHLLPKLEDIVAHHLKGTHFNIHVDPTDGLLHQGQEGYQLTWMDAKVGDWVVTPRRGKTVETNALWYNALRLMERWVSWEKGQEPPTFYAEHAQRCYDSFNAKFWSDELGYLRDVVDGEDPRSDNAVRPNQVFAISLPFPVLRREHWEAVMNKVRADLLTPVGLRSLSPDHPDFKPRYFGDLRARDAAYHQGTVWAWLIGPYIDAWLKLHPDDKNGACQALHGLIEHLDHACVGSASEVFDAEAPYTPRGCIAQAWSIAEVLRCWMKLHP